MKLLQAELQTKNEIITSDQIKSEAAKIAKDFGLTKTLQTQQKSSSPSKTLPSGGAKPPETVQLSLRTGSARKAAAAYLETLKE